MTAKITIHLNHADNRDTAAIVAGKILRNNVADPSHGVVNYRGRASMRATHVYETQKILLSKQLATMHLELALQSVCDSHSEKTLAIRMVPYVNIPPCEIFKQETEPLVTMIKTLAARIGKEVRPRLESQGPKKCSMCNRDCVSSSHCLLISCPNKCDNSEEIFKVVPWAKFEFTHPCSKNAREEESIREEDALGLSEIPDMRDDKYFVAYVEMVGCVFNQLLEDVSPDVIETEAIGDGNVFLGLHLLRPILPNKRQGRYEFNYGLCPDDAKLISTQERYTLSTLFNDLKHAVYSYVSWSIIYPLHEQRLSPKHLRDAYIRDEHLADDPMKWYAHRRSCKSKADDAAQMQLLIAKSDGYGEFLHGIRPECIRYIVGSTFY